VSEPQASTPSSKRSKILKSDEWIALVVAFGTLGTIGAYTMTRDRGGLFANTARNEQQAEADGTASDASDGLGGNGAIAEIERRARDANERISTQLDEAGAIAETGTSALGLRSVGSPADRPAVSASRSTGAAGAAGAAGLAGAAGAAGAADSSAGADGAAAAGDASSVGTAGESVEPGAPIVESGAASVSGDITATSAPTDFSDVSADRWSKPFIDGLSERGLISGMPDGTFAPERPVTRAELAAQIQQIFDRDENLRDSIAFGDVSSDYWARAAIDKAVAIGFLSGYPNSQFGPDRPVSRLEVAISLATGLGLNPSENPMEVLAVFPDATDIAAWAQPKTAAATQAGFAIVDPARPTFNPDAPATREVVAAMLYQALVRAGKAEPIASDRLVTP